MSSAFRAFGSNLEMACETTVDTRIQARINLTGASGDVHFVCILLTDPINVSGNHGETRVCRLRTQTMSCCLRISVSGMPLYLNMEAGINRGVPRFDSETLAMNTSVTKSLSLL